MENLPELRDIHLPDGVSAFPPAFGWWMLLILAIAIVLCVALIKKWLKFNKKRYAQKLIEQADVEHPVFCALQCSEILRRICVHKYPFAAALIGHEWVEFLLKHCAAKLDKKSTDLLVNAPYLSEKTHAFSEADAQNVKTFCHIFIGENL